jgi:hypothetical protein
VAALATLAALAAVTSCGSSRAPLVGVQVVDGEVVVTSACFDELGVVARLVTDEVGDQIVVDDLAGSGGSPDEDCASGASTGLAPGPDVVDLEAGVRWALVGDGYRQVEYCGPTTRRCVPFPTEEVPPSCSAESLRFATVGMYGGVHPVETLRCEGRWALVELDTRPDRGLTRVLLVSDGARWLDSGFDARWQCPDPARRSGVPDLPDWACTED